MAPGQILGEPVTPASDVWALGITLVEALIRKHPFVPENTAAMVFAIVNQPTSHAAEQMSRSLSA